VTVSGTLRGAGPWVGLAARLVLGGVFVVAGLLKIPDPAESARAVQAYDLLPPDVGEAVGYGLPFLEVALGALLLLGYATRLAAAVTGVLLVVFVAGVASAWARGLSIDCGCFGSGGDVAPGATQYLQEILRDAGLLLAAAWLVVRPDSRLSLDGAARGDRDHDGRAVDTDRDGRAVDTDRDGRAVDTDRDGRAVRDLGEDHRS
jgi:uncharacterized membrane protein YphA (DoxX/SURF4 family)